MGVPGKPLRWVDTVLRVVEQDLTEASMMGSQLYLRTISRGIRRLRKNKDRSSLTGLVSSSLPGTCPSCSMPYDRAQKRRLVDSCGHERCYSCIGRNDHCSLCLQTGTVVGDNSSILMETSLSDSLSSQVLDIGRQPENTEDSSLGLKQMKTASTADWKKRPRLVNNSLDSGVFFNSSPDNTLPRRRKEVSRRNSHELQKSNSSTSVESQTAPRPTHAKPFLKKTVQALNRSFVFTSTAAQVPQTSLF